MSHALATDTRTAAAAPAPADVRAALTFITRSDTKPVFHSSASTGGAPKVLFDTERHTVAIRDMRPFADAFSLDREGFELRRHRTAVADLYEKLEGHWPEELGVEPRAARFVSAFARKKEFAPRMCWDPDTVGDPEALPDWTGYCGTGFGMIVHKRDGIPPCDRCVAAYDYPDPYPGFNGEKFRALRERRGWARNPLGRKVGIDPSTIQYWEEGRSRPQREGRLDRVLSVLDATYEDVCDM